MSNQFKKICIFSNTYFPNTNAGSLRIKYIVIGLIDRGWSVSVVTNTPNAVKSSTENLVILKPLFAKSPSLIKIAVEEFYFAIRAIYYLYSNRGSKFYISSPGFISSIIVSFLMKFLNIKYFLEVRDLYPQAYVDANLISKKSFIYYILLKLSRRMHICADLIITVTTGMKKILLLENETVLLSYNGFPRDFLNIKKNNNNRKDLLVGIHGNFGRFQAVNVLIDVIRLSNNLGIKFLIVGNGLYFKKIKETLSNLDNVEVIDPLPLMSLAEKLSLCDIGLSLRDNSGLSQISFPVRVWEYIGIGLPVLSSPVNNEASIFILKNKIGFSIDLEPKKIVDKLVFLKNNKFLLDEAQSNLLKIRIDYTREQQVMNLLDELKIK